MSMVPSIVTMASSKTWITSSNDVNSSTQKSYDENVNRLDGDGSGSGSSSSSLQLDVYEGAAASQLITVSLPLSRRKVMSGEVMSGKPRSLQAAGRSCVCRQNFSPCRSPGVCNGLGQSVLDSSTADCPGETTVCCLGYCNEYVNVPAGANVPCAACHGSACTGACVDGGKTCMGVCGKRMS